MMEAPATNEAEPEVSSIDPYESPMLAAELGEAPEIDLHGQSVQEAIQRAETFLHQQMMRGSEVVKIIHGRGEGKLRAAIQIWLKRQQTAHGLIAAFRDALYTPGQQNAVTIVALHRLTQRKASTS